MVFSTRVHLSTWHQPVTLLWAQLHEVPLLKTSLGLHRHHSRHKAWWPELRRSRCGHILLWEFNTSKSALIILHGCALIMHRIQEKLGGVSYFCVTKTMFLHYKFPTLWIEFIFEFPELMSGHNTLSIILNLFHPVCPKPLKTFTCQNHELHI